MLCVNASRSVPTVCDGTSVRLGRVEAMPPQRLLCRSGRRCRTCPYMPICGCRTLQAEVYDVVDGQDERSFKVRLTGPANLWGEYGSHWVRLHGRWCMRHVQRQAERGMRPR